MKNYIIFFLLCLAFIACKNRKPIGEIDVKSTERLKIQVENTDVPPLRVSTLHKYPSMFFMDSLTGFVLLNDEVGQCLYKTTDGGHGWERIFVNEDFFVNNPGWYSRGSFDKIVFNQDFSTGYLYGRDVNLYITTDTAKTWKIVTNQFLKNTQRGHSFNYYDIHFIGKDTCLILYGVNISDLNTNERISGNIYLLLIHPSNNGNVLKKIPIDYRFCFFDVTESNTIFAKDWRTNEIFRSEDFGETFNFVSSKGGNKVFNDTTTFLFESSGLFFSSDFFDWQRIITFPRLFPPTASRMPSLGIKQMGDRKFIFVHSDDVFLIDLEGETKKLKYKKGSRDGFITDFQIIDQETLYFITGDAILYKIKI